MAKHHFTKKHKKAAARGAPMREEEAANTEGDPARMTAPPVQQAPMPATQPGPMTPPQGAPPGAGIPGQATGGDVSKVAPMSRMRKMYSPKTVMKRS